MAGKRSATYELNHDNWDQDEKPEERGTFQKAGADALKNRVIKTAKRRNPISSVRDNEEGKKNVFASFTGFQNKPPSSDYSFLKESDSTKVNGTDSMPKPHNIFGNSSNNNTNVFTGVPVSTQSNSLNSTNCISSTSKISEEKSDTYFSKLKGLNESVSAWISKKVEENPLISLQPIFKDYDKYLDEIESEESSGQKNAIPTFNFKSSKILPVPDSTSEKSSTPQFKFGPSTVSKGGEESKNDKPKIPDTKTTNASTGVLPTFSFGATSSTTKPFSFGTTTTSSTKLSFGTTSTSSPAKPLVNFELKKTAESEKPNEDKEEEEDEPPKVEFVPVIEKDHLYTTRCKVFVKKEGKFAEKGVGNLFLKPVESSEKVQLIIRADTNLGNLLCNFILSESIPIKKMGTKDVMLVTIPMPEAQPPPVPILLRVKSSEEADKLLKVLEQHKK